MQKYHDEAINLLYIWEKARSGHASPPLTGYPIWWPQGQRSLTNICWNWVDHSMLQRTSIGTREGLVETHDRWTWSRHNLIVRIVIWDRRLGWRQDGVGQVWTTRARVRLLPAQLPSVIHSMLPVKQRELNYIWYSTLSASIKSFV